MDCILYIIFIHKLKFTLKYKAKLIKSKAQDF
jgi:hypothetical protein